MAKILATAIVVNNLSSSVVLGKELNVIDNKKDNSIINESLNQSKIYSNIFRIEKTVGSTEEFLRIINQGGLEEIKLSRDIDLSKISKGLDINGSNIVIDGNGNNIYVSRVAEDIKGDFFKLQGDGIVLKNLNIVCKGENEENNNALISILGDDVKLENVSIESNFNKAIEVLDGKNANIKNCKVNNKKNSSYGIRVDNGEVTLKDFYLENKSGIGIDVLGKASKVNLEGTIKINSPIEVRGQLRDGAVLNSDNEQLINEKKVFGYTYYDVAKEEELVKNKYEFLEALNNKIVKSIKLIDNIDLRGEEEYYYKVLNKDKNIDKNNYHIIM